jgi:UDP-glucose 4-epimerase
MRVLLTGGAGFIGSHLAERLLEEGHKVVVVDNLSTGRMENIFHLKGRRGLDCPLDSIFNRQLMAELVDLADIIFHLAAMGVRLIAEDPVWTIETNVKGTELVLGLAAKKKKRVIISSSSEVYGKSEKDRFVEGDDLLLGSTTKSRWSYAASKILDEFLGLAYREKKGVPVVILRFFNIVGPRQTGQYGMVVPRFVAQVLKGEPITVYGDGTQTRTFTHVKDAVDAMVKVAFHPDSAGEIFNIGGDQEISIMDLAMRTKELLGSSSEVVFVPYERAYEAGFEDMRRRAPDIGKVQSWVGYKPQYSVDDIILDVAQYERARAGTEPIAPKKEGLP